MNTYQYAQDNMLTTLRLLTYRNHYHTTHTSMTLTMLKQIHYYIINI